MSYSEEFGGCDCLNAKEAAKSVVKEPMSKYDNLALRSQKMKCSTCMWFVLKKFVSDVGRCRRHSPTMSGFPVVFGTDWCGDHKLNEESL